MDRRGFLGAVPAAAFVGAFTGRRSHTSPDESRRPPRLDLLGVQLYTVRAAMAERPDETLAAIAEIGYREVELAGLYGMTAREMRSKLDASGLRAASSHHGIGLVREGWTATLDDAQELGQSLIVVPSLPSEERTHSGLSRIADDFNRAGEEARAAGLRFGYHNHDGEFEALPDGTLPMDLLLDQTDAENVDWQMDVFWVAQGLDDAAAPFRYLAQRGERITSVHVKDRTSEGDMVAVGDGVIDFARFIPQAEGQGLRHAFVEHDWPDDPIESVRRSYRHLTSGEMP